jgi:hypothetical protein
MSWLISFAFCEEHTEFFLIILCFAGPERLEITFCAKGEKPEFVFMSFLVMILDLLAYSLMSYAACPLGMSISVSCFSNYRCCLLAFFL